MTLSTALLLPSYVVDRNFATKLYNITVLCLQILINNTVIIIIIMNSWSLGPIRPVPLDLEDAVGLSIFVLVSPDHDVNLDDRGQPIATDDIFSFLPCLSFSFGITYKSISQKSH
jgi:hypothetical protein